MDIEKMKYVFSDIDVEYIHKAKFSILIRPLMRDDPEYWERIMYRVPPKEMD